jgi:hypothetical protein
MYSAETGALNTAPNTFKLTTPYRAGHDESQLGGIGAPGLALRNDQHGDRHVSHIVTRWHRNAPFVALANLGGEQRRVLDDRLEVLQLGPK